MTIKKVVVSAAGQGTRMLELTNDKSKHLISVHDKPFLFYLIRNIIEAGYKEIILVVGYHSELVKDFIKHYFADSEILFTFVNQFEVLGPKEKMYGTACPLMCVKDLVGGDDFISLVGDNYYTVQDLKNMNKDDDFCYVAGREEEHPEKFGVLIEDGEFLGGIVEKPPSFVGNLVNTSLYKFTPDIFEKLPLIEKSLRGEYEITDAISLLAQDRKVKIVKTKNYWMDFGNADDIKKFSEFLKNDHKKI